MDYTDVMDVLESLILDVYKFTSTNCKEEQKIIGHEIKVQSSPFERITYYNVLDEVKAAGVKLEFGEDLLDSLLRIVGKKHPGFYFITDWTMQLRPFYISEKDDDPSLSRSIDLQYGYLESSSGGTRLHDSKVLTSRLREQGLDPAQFVDHLKAFDWGMPPHAGWGLGLERLMMTLTGIDNVREVILYPRDPDRLKP